MRIPPNPHPIARIRNTLLTALSLTAFWLLLSLASCANPRAGLPGSAPWPRAASAAAPGPHPAVSMFAPTGPIPLAEPFVRMHAKLSTRT